MTKYYFAELTYPSFYNITNRFNKIKNYNNEYVYIYIHKITISIQSNYIFYRILFNYKAFEIVIKYFLFLNTVPILILYIK